MQTIAWFVAHVTCRLTDKNRDRLWHSLLSNRVSATFAFFLHAVRAVSINYLMLFDLQVH